MRAKVRQRASNGTFALIEHAWPLADLEVEGYGERIRRILEEEMQRGGEQEGVGRVTIARIVEMMAEHDAGHAAELRALLNVGRGFSPPVPGEAG